MRVLYFHQHFSTPNGSIGTRSYEMAKALLRDGHQVTMVCGSYAQGHTGLTAPFKYGIRRGVVEGIDIIEVNASYSNAMGVIKRFGVFFRFAMRSVGIALNEPADIVFATSTPLTAGLPGVVAKWIRRKPFVFEVRDLWPELPKAMGIIKNPVLLSAMSALEWVCYRSADRLIALAPGIADGIAGRGVDRSQIAMIPNGSDLDIFSPHHSPWRPCGVKSDDLLAVFTGAHGPANGLGAVLDAAKILNIRGQSSIKIALVGAGREKEQLKARAKEEGLSNIVFLDPVPKTRLAGLLAGADLGLQILQNVPAFSYGTSPNKFFDYLAAGVPILTNYPGWVADMICDNDCGYVAAPDQPAAFADALIKAHENRAVLRQMGRNARSLAERQFARKSLSDQWIGWVAHTAAETQRRTKSPIHSPGE